MDQLNVIAWQGRTENNAGLVSQQTAAQLHATLGSREEPAPINGDPLPPLWHWCGFPPLAPMEELGPDGHPRLGSFLPPIRLDRRMWAGGALRFHAPLHVGEPLQRRSVVRGITEKDGASGPMVFVTVDHAIYGERGLAIEERQDIVYLPIPDSYTPPKPRQMPETPNATNTVPMPETLLFRYSALTFNAHRIHYDKAYAKDIEHYPGLVVHGPLQATLLMQLAVEKAGRTPEDFHFRGVHPMFAGTDLDLAAVEDDGALALFSGQDGHQGMQATAIFGGTA
ncbi:FAS1-like dehydratase domain-containing protein [Marivita hallyeonensis]|uniref:3-methylfumaryl-CoA hydratase n=1 Tax=Marivita hallyeonensis TaxID=996342 RepID=A0A1M5Y8G2_9RHOB|nr:MaoC family dehydratase N-terminal domain-containing protein [Marivita hallyeonensis]SHI08104.1 3-methylfumaryl-CoA hydratase [Marivita hallyeonensis]